MNTDIPLALPLGIAPDRLQILIRALIADGWAVTAAEQTRESVLVGFDFMPGRRPSWLKAFELPYAEASPQGFARAIAAWKAHVRHDLENGHPSFTVRTMLARHGPEAVQMAMRGGFDA